jgi:hypothetical protein
MNQSQQMNESLGCFGEAGDSDLIDAVAKAIEPGDKLIGMGPKIKATGLFKKVDFITSPMAAILAVPKKGGRTIAVVNKKNADDADRTVGQLAIGFMG